LHNRMSSKKLTLKPTIHKPMLASAAHLRYLHARTSPMISLDGAGYFHDQARLCEFATKHCSGLTHNLCRD
jgi:hypothetical protein